MFKHFLATRFNIRVGNWETTKNGEMILDESWMEDRFKLFENYCLPSVKNQLNQNFIWCIFFDLNTKENYKYRIEKHANSYRNIRVFFVDGIGGMHNSLKNFINMITAGEFEFVITSRLDNDDLIHQDYIQTIQRLFRPFHNTVIDLRSGYQISIESGQNEIRNFYSPFNPFVSLIEKKECIQTIFNKMHKDWGSVENIIVYDKRQLWIELVHEKNKLNTTNRSLEYSLKFNSSEFGIDGKVMLKKSLEFYFLLIKKHTNRVMVYSKKIIKRGLLSGFGK